MFSHTKEIHYSVPIEILNRNICSRSHPRTYHANIEIPVISRYHGNLCRENIKLLILSMLHLSITELSVSRNASLGCVCVHTHMNKVFGPSSVYFLRSFSRFLSFFSLPCSSVGNLGNLLTRWDLSSNPGNWDFSSVRLHGRRGKGTAESFS